MLAAATRDHEKLLQHRCLAMCLVALLLQAQPFLLRDVLDANLLCVSPVVIMLSFHRCGEP